MDVANAFDLIFVFE